MGIDDNNENTGQSLIERLDKLEYRISRIEGALSLSFDEEKYKNGEDRFLQKKKPVVKDDDSVENRIGEHGMAWLGNIILTFGIIFLTQYFNSLGFTFLSSVLGLITTGIVFYLSKYFKINYQSLALLFQLTGYVLLYYFIMRLFFFMEEPVIKQKYIVIFFLLVHNVFLFIDFLKSKNTIKGAIGVVLITLTAILTDNSVLCFILFTLAAYGHFYAYKQIKSAKLLLFSIFTSYIGILVYILGNPIVGHNLHFIQDDQFILIFVIAIAAIYSQLALQPKSEHPYVNDGIFSAIILNGILFSLILGISVIALFEKHFIWIFLSLFIICLAFSAWLKLKSEWVNVTALYALYSFMAFSVAVFSFYALPWALFWLSIESLLVVAISLWYRTKIIIILNLALYTLLLLLNLFYSDFQSITYFTFGIVAIFSARIINWKKERLEIKTEFLRNTYLIAAFIIFPISLYKTVPAQYVTISWALLAVGYFLLSQLLKKVKYRYLAIGTLIATAFYLFIIDMSKIELVFRVIAFLGLSLILIFISIFYSRRRKLSEDNGENINDD